MEILKRAKGFQDGEVVAWNEKNVHEEVLKRNVKAGYIEKDGTPRIHTSAGKGDNYRPTNKKKFDENYMKIFGHD